MTTNEERHAFCEENPKNFICGCRSAIEDYNDRYNEYESKARFINDWWAPEFEKYKRARNNIKNFIPIGADVTTLASYNKLTRTTLMRNRDEDDNNCKNYICNDAMKDDFHSCDQWYPTLCRDRGCDWLNLGKYDHSENCDCGGTCTGHDCYRLWSCQLNSRGHNNMLSEWENTVGKK